MSELLLPTSPVAIESLSPNPLLLYGPPKVGKTTMLSKLKNCLIIDTEKGTSKVEAMKVKVNSLVELGQVGQMIASSKHRYDYIAIDTVDNISFWVESGICHEKGVANIADLPYGAGYNMLRDRVLSWLSNFQALDSRLIIIGHLKKTLYGSENSEEVSTSSLDLVGKLKNMLMASVDSIGFVHRNDKGELMVSFKHSDEVECGSRCGHLAGKVLPFEWEKIYID